MKKLLGFFLVILLTSCVATAQQYKSHTVARGETVKSIAKQYNISVDDIIRLNPEARRGVRRNNVLVIPSKSVKVSKDVEVTFTNHKVRRKETLYSIAKKYGVTVDDIKKFNEKVAKEGLKKGDRIAIPKFKTKVADVVDTTTKDVEETKNEEATFETYIVKAKETKWGIAHSYGLTIEELEDLNPEIKDGLKIGQEIKLPIRTEKPQVATTEKYVFYDVKPKQTIYTLTRKLGVSEDELILLNPALKDGLKAGMVLKLPVAKTESLEVVDAVIVDKFNFLENASTENVSNIVIMLPFKLNEMNMDSVSQTKAKLRKDRLLGYATEFYTGSLMALDSMKQLGFSVNVKVLDNQGNTSGTRKVMTNNSFSDVHAVIGPIIDSNIEIVASALKSDGIPVISPLTSKEVKHRNVYQTIPGQELLEAKMLDFIKRNGQDKNVIIIADKNNATIKTKLQSILPNNVVFNPEAGNYIKPTAILPLLKEDQENWVILETNDLSLIANVTSVLNSYTTSEKRKIVLLTTDRDDNYNNNDNIYNSHLANLNFHYPSIEKPSSLNNLFVKNYKREYGISPSKTATRGFDITFDILLRLAYDQNLAKSVRKGSEASYVENKFDYTKKILGGFFNKGIYIVKYDGLEIKEVK
ncbi:LysM peptidoglycan-binding domain-containing protein [Kordia sp. YSTF-M3]|uniref:LysM peptidoglycan-binding domain-containing protein n=1 Tax=Kordia aestuariivivens TaxID=2759037 RepID=A0ABR7QFY4_9FLAO|nr:LysM peptidoglycan-binding domain-containing protein [Kordia aestuariivivens]MBC8757477.1 LysM peptidoglycan-binding domain-containing protein [Kordia aestuariivivens]